MASPPGVAVGISRVPSFLLGFVSGSASTIVRGSGAYHLWVLSLLGVLAAGAWCYGVQLDRGLIVTGMRDPMSWGFYIGNFAFLVGVAAAAVMLVIPAYIYHWKPIKEVVLFGEIMAIAAIVMCMLFVSVDLGRPDRIWHLLPLVGNPNFPHSLLIWDIFVLSCYFVLNYFIVSYIVYKGYTGQPYSKRFLLSLVFLSIPVAIGIHTVTAFLFMGLKARPFWHSAILAPRFLASAFCSGPALMVIVFQVVQRFYGRAISDAAFQKIGELLAYAMVINLFLLASELFTEFYARTAHSVHAELQWFGAGELASLPIYAWGAVAFNVSALIIFMFPALRSRLPLLTIGCLLAVVGVYVEKGMGLLLPGMTPDMRGEIYAYHPTWVEVGVSAGIWAAGALLFTLMSRVAIAVERRELLHPMAPRQPETEGASR